MSSPPTKQNNKSQVQKKAKTKTSMAQIMLDEITKLNETINSLGVKNFSAAIQELDCKIEDSRKQTSLEINALEKKIETSSQEAFPADSNSLTQAIKEFEKKQEIQNRQLLDELTALKLHVDQLNVKTSLMNNQIISINDRMAELYDLIGKAGSRKESDDDKNSKKWWQI